MGIIVEFRSLAPTKPRQSDDTVVLGEIVIFPGVRIERQNLDLGYRIRDAAGREDFQCLGRQWRPGKTY